MDHEEKIIRYLDGELSGEELRKLEEEMGRDPGLARRVEELKRIQEIARKSLQDKTDPEAELDEQIRHEIRETVREFKAGTPGDKDIPEDFESGLQEAASNYFMKRQPALERLKILWYGLAALIILGGILSIILLRPFTSMSPAEIYAAHFSSFEKTREIAELTRSDDDFMFAVSVYESGDYERAVALFEILSDSSGTREYALFYMGHSFMHLNGTNKAIESFETLVEEEAGELLLPAKWYLGLCYLKVNMPEKAMEEMEEIAGSDSPYRQDAKTILQYLR